MGLLKKVSKAVKKVGKQVGKLVNSHVDLLTGGQFSKQTGASSYFEGHQDKLLAGTLAALAAAGGMAAAGGAGSLFGSGVAASGTEAAAGTAAAGTAEAAAGTAGAAGILGSLFSGAAGGAGSFLGGLVNTGLGLGVNYLSAQDQLKNQLQLQDRAFQYNTQMWNEQNAYNSPAAQMQRYKEAGLNPMLIYGNGVSSAGNASSAPHYEAPTYKGIDLNSILSFQSMANLMQQNELLAQQTELAKMQTLVQGINASYVPQLKEAEVSNIKAQTKNTDAHTKQIDRGDNLSLTTWLRDKLYSVIPWFKDNKEWLTPKIKRSNIITNPADIDLLGV